MSIDAVKVKGEKEGLASFLVRMPDKQAAMPPVTKAVAF